MTANRMTTRSRTVSLIAGGLLLLAACGSSELLGIESLFGPDFRTAFNRAPNDAPSASDALSISYDGEAGVSTTKTPVDL